MLGLTGALALQLACLSEAVYNEARGISYHEMVLVGAVVHNRVLDGRWGDSYCDVIESPNQFSYLPEGTKAGHLPMYEDEAKERAMEAAYSVLMLDNRPYFDNILYYHTPSVKPSWDYSKLRTLDVGESYHEYYGDR